MKVALVIEKFTPAGGAERQCVNFARFLVSRHHEVHVFARTIAEGKGYLAHPVPAEGLFRHQSFDAQSRKLLQKEPFDVIHSYCRTSFQDILRLGGGTHREYLIRTDPA
jgi:UDP-glucose:(heptosyl)LPS alpha-1,3-glucosyltransferase